MEKRTAITIPPGVYRRGSEAEVTSGRWYMANLVRWIEGVLRPIAGWEKVVLSGLVASPIRAMHQWTSKDGILRTALLCEGHLYVLEGNALLDISPVPPIVPPYGNLEVGGFGDDPYYGAGGGLANPGNLLPANPGPIAPIYHDPTGYGTERGPQPERVLIGAAFTLDNWGEDLLAMVSTDGRLLRWKPSDPPGTKASAVTNAPTGNRTFAVTQERHVQIFQSGGDFAAWAWCDQEDIENWNFTDITSMAGYYYIEPAEPIIAAKAFRFGTAIFTPTRLYMARYLALPYIYSQDYIGVHAMPLTAQSIVGLSDSLIWPSLDGFWEFNGTTVAPIDCDVLDWFQRNINARYATVRTSGMFLGNQTECWWFFPSQEQRENDRYVVYNPQEKWWTIGRLTRTCGVAGSTLSYPYMSDGLNVYRHEYGRFYYDAPELPYAQSGALQIADGDRRLTITRGIVDTRAPAGDVLFSFNTKAHRIMNGTPPVLTKGPYRVREDGKLDLRVTGRDITMRISSARNGVEPWTFGKMLLQIAQRGRR
jgi:hypothetical protein